MVVVGFNDWLCSGCLDVHADLQLLLRELEQTHSGAVSLVLEDWPWDLECNPYNPGTQSMHPGACDVAVAVRLARDRGDRALINRIRDHFEDWRTRLPDELRAKEKTPARDAALASVKESVVRGQRVGIKATPTYFVNGVRIEGVKTREIEWAIRLEL